jgi:hypothetical protein
LTQQGVPSATATQIGQLPPVSSLFAAFLGVNPIQTLLGPSGVLHTLPAANVATLTGPHFFPNLISAPFHHGLVIVFGAATALSVLGALASLMRGRSVRALAPTDAVPAAEFLAQTAHLELDESL